MPTGERRANRVVDAQHLRPGDLRQVLLEPGDDGVLGSIEVEMIDLHVGQHRAEQRQFEVGAVALVGLDDQPFAPGPLGSGAHVGHVATDDERRPQTGRGEDQHQHRCRRGLAVRAGNSERLRLGTDRRQHAGSGQHRDPRLRSSHRARCSWPGPPSRQSPRRSRRRDGGRGRRTHRRPRLAPAPARAVRGGRCR